ncbi:kelch-like protein 10 [Dermacentor albipictus]|uniref:kelch-like protein 10 n=1 Tax=Dermacentor albipictus TaxID=60249 RepID=UPI0031FDF954
MAPARQRLKEEKDERQRVRAAVLLLHVPRTAEGSPSMRKATRTEASSGRGATVGSSAARMGNSGDTVEEVLNRDTLEALWDMRSSGVLCDGLLKTTDGGQFPVHRVVMASCSEYFRALFSSHLSSGGRCEVLVQGVSSEALAIIVEFAYKRITWVGCDNVERLLKAADYLCVMGMIKDCCDFLLSIMTPENCLSIHNLAKMYNCFDLAAKAKDYLMEHFVEVAKRSDEFLRLDADDVVSILSDENLNVVKEESVWKAALRWIEFDPASRTRHMARLFECVRTGLVDTDFFVEKIKTHKYIVDDDGCRPRVIQTLRFLYDLDVVVHNDEVPTPVFARPRIPHEVMFVIGGWMAGGPTTYIESYDTKADRWIKVETVDPEGPRAYHKCAAIGNDIYVIGGFNGEDYFSSVRCFNAYTKQWRSVTPMHVKRCYVSIAVLKDIIYAMGGYDGRNRQNTAEKFDHRTNQWTMIAPMHMQRSDACATAHDGYVYVTGGFSGNECLSSAERYDPMTDQWTAIASMRYRRSGVGCVGFRDCVYAIGGFNGTTRLFSAEKYNPDTNTWTSLPNMYTPRSNFAVAIIDNLVFAIGGFNGESTTNLVECYDPSTDQWCEATDMNETRSALAACVISGLPNIRDYVHQHRDNLMEEKRLKMLDILKHHSRQLNGDDDLLM